MIERYTLPEMGKIWSLENEWRTILNVELAACDAMAELGEIPAEAKLISPSSALRKSKPSPTTILLPF